MTRIPSPDDQLHTRIPSVLPLTTPLIFFLQRVRHHVPDLGVFPERTTGILRLDLIFLRDPAGFIDGGEVEEIGFEKVGVEGGGDGVAAFAGRVDGGGEEGGGGEEEGGEKGGD